MSTAAETPAPLPDVAAPGAGRTRSAAHLETIMTIPVQVQVFLGSTTMPIAELMALERDAVIALNHDISDPVDIVVNGRVIARGELVALENDPSKIGVKLVEIVGQPDTAA